MEYVQGGSSGQKTETMMEVWNKGKAHVAVGRMAWDQRNDRKGCALCCVVLCCVCCGRV